MKKNAKKIFLFLAVVITAVVCFAFGTGAADDDFEYESYGEGTIEIISCYLDGGDIEIPSEIDGKTVVSICDNAFGFNLMSAVTIPVTVERIGDYAFDGCDGLSNVYYNGSAAQWNAISIGEGNEALLNAEIHFAETACSHENVIEYEAKEPTCTEDGYTSGKYCSDCETWVEGHNIITAEGHIDNNSDDYCDLCAASMQTGKCGDNVNYILNKDGTLLISGTGAMYDYYSDEMEGELSPFIGNLNIKKVEISEGVTSVGSYAFYGCENMTDIKISSSVESISSSAFSNSINIFIDERNAYYSIDEYGVLFNKEKTLLIRYPGKNTNTNYSIPDSVVTIAASAFSGCDYLKRVDFGCNVITIGSSAFSGCESLESVNLNNKVETIGARAFYACSSLTNMVISESVTRIESDVFGKCYGLYSVTILNPECEIDDEWWMVKDISIPEWIVVYGYEGSTAEEYTESIEHPENFKVICEHKNTMKTDAVEVTCVTYGYTEGVFCNDCDWWVSGHQKIKQSHDDENEDGICEHCKREMPIETGSAGGYWVGPDPWVYDYDGAARYNIYADGTVEYYGEGTVIIDRVANDANTVFCEGITRLQGNDLYGPCYTLMTIPDSVKEITFNYLPYSIHCNKNSYAAEFAAAKGIGVTYLDGDDAESIVGGDIGNLSWSLDKRIGTLKISGAGEIIDFADDYAPWFEYLDCITAIELSEEISKIGERAFYGLFRVREIKIPDSVTTIKNNAFSLYCDYCGSAVLEKLEIGKGLISVDEKAFYLYGNDYVYLKTRIKEIRVPDLEILDLLLKGNRITFRDNQRLYVDGKLETKLTLPVGMTKINNEFFENCNSLTEIKISETVKEIGGWAFYNCQNLESLIISDSVESIGECAFSGCDKLKDVYYTGTEEQWKKISINSYNENLTEATIHYHKHEYVSSVIKEATCTEAGLTEFTCTCGKNYTKTIGEIPHTFTSYTSDGNATCIADGTKTAVCDVCNKAKDSVTDEGSKNNAEHKYSVRAGSRATCTDNGERIYVCDVCETATYTEIIPAIGGHSFVACLGEDPTCTDDGFIEYCCEVCESESYREIVPATGHDYDSVVTAPTCESIGYTTHTCLDCGEVYTDTFVNANGHKGGTATCTQKAKCSVCGEAYGSLKAHTYKTVTTKATLSKNGKIESKCSCGKVKSTQTIAKISSVTLSATKYIHDGKNKTPTVTVKDANGKKLVKNTDYKLSVASKRSGIGKYTVKVTFIGNYEGTKNVYFTILPGKPVSVKSAAQTTSSVKLTWSKVSGAAGYTVYRYSPSKKAYVKAGTTEGTSLTVKGLLTGTKYTFKVVAYGKTSGGKVYNSEGYTLLKTATKTKTPAISKIATTKGKAVLTHTNVSGETGYTVYYSTKKDSGFKKYNNFKADTTTCNITKLTSGKTYYFKVRTYIKTDSGYVYSPWSAVKGIKVK